MTVNQFWARCERCQKTTREQYSVDAVIREARSTGWWFTDEQTPQLCLPCARMGQPNDGGPV